MFQSTKLNFSYAVANLFVFLFVYTAVSKIIEFRLFEAILAKSPLIGSGAPIIARGLPVIELLVSGLLVVKKTQQTGLYAALLLMAVFTLYILYMLLFVPELPCSCGGVLKALSWKTHFAFNLIFTGLALLAVIRNSGRTGKPTAEHSFQTA